MNRTLESIFGLLAIVLALPLAALFAVAFGVVLGCAFLVEVVAEWLDSKRMAKR